MDHLIQKCPSKPQCHLLDGAKYGLALFDPGIFRVWRRSVGEAKGEGQTQQTFTETDGRTAGRRSLEEVSLKRVRAQNFAIFSNHRHDGSHLQQSAPSGMLQSADNSPLFCIMPCFLHICI